MLKKYAFVMAALSFTTHAWCDQVYWYANKDSHLKSSPTHRAENVGQINWGDTAVIIDSSSHEEWVKVKNTCYRDLDGWVQSRHLTPSTEFKKASVWQIERYRFETASGDYGIDTEIDFNRAGNAFLSIQELGDGVTPRPTEHECSTYTTNTLAQLRCGNNDSIKITIQFDSKNGNLKSLPCPIGGPTESHITEYKKFTFKDYPTEDASSQIETWLNSNVIGHDNDAAKFASVHLTRDNNSYSARFISQFEFMCALEFDSLGLPYMLKSCTSEKFTYDDMDSVIYLTCTSNKKETTCRGPWKSHSPFSRRYAPDSEFALILKH